MALRSICFAGIVALLSCSAFVLSQDPRTKISQLQEMKKLEFLVGEWKGDSWTEFVPGQKRFATGTEIVQSKLDGLVITIEGTHFRKSNDKNAGLPVHSAFGVISFDEKSKQLRFHAYTALGGYVEATASVGTRKLEWSMQIPQVGNMRYTISINNKGQWFEIGEMSSDNKEWRKFFEMTLDRVKTK